MFDTIGRCACLAASLIAMTGAAFGAVPAAFEPFDASLTKGPFRCDYIAHGKGSIYAVSGEAEAQAVERIMKATGDATKAADAGDTKLAEQRYRLVLAMAKQGFGVEHSTVLERLDDMSRMLESAGEMAAKPLENSYYLEAIAARKCIFTMDLELKASPYELYQNGTNLAELYERYGDYRDAEPILREAHRLIVAAKDDNYIPMIASALGKNLKAQKRYAEAEPLLALRDEDEIELGEVLEAENKFAQAEPIWRKINDDARLAKNLAAQGRYREAAQKGEATVADAEKRNVPPPASTPQEKKQKAEKFRADMAMAVKSYEDMAAQLDKKGMHKEAQAYRRMAGVMKDIDDSDLSDYHNWRYPRLSYGAAPDQVRLARWKVKGRDYQGAATGLESACPVLTTKMIVDVEPIAARTEDTGEIVTAAQCYELLAVARWGSDAATPAPPDVAFRAAQEAVQSRAGSALSRSGARRIAEAEGAGPILAAIDKEMAEEDVISKPTLQKWPMERMTGLEGAEEMNMVADMADMQKALKPHEQKMEALIGELTSKVADYVDLSDPSPLSIAELQSRSGPNAALLADNEAVVLWMLPRETDKGLVFAISKKRAGWAEISLSTTEIAAKVRSLREQIDPCAYGLQGADCAAGEAEFSRRIAYDLYAALLGAPAIQNVIDADGITTLLVVPSGSLTALPPSVLLTEPPSTDSQGDRSPEMLRNAPWLIRKKAIAVLPSVSALRTLRVAARREAKGAAEPLFMMADPDFSGGASTSPNCRTRGLPRSIGSYFGANANKRALLASLCPLPGTRQEALAMADLLKARPDDVLTGREAREARLHAPQDAARLGSASVVAFATHGLVSGDVGLGEPALALAAPLAEERTDDGLLTASKAALLRLHADWVILSACNTASPDGNGAEGLSGLARAFFYAGARRLLVSHWRVSDSASELITTKTLSYWKLRQSDSAAEALRHATLDVMRGEGRSADERNDLAFPAAWAPFVLVGTP